MKKFLTKFWLCIAMAIVCVVLASAAYPIASALTDLFMGCSGFFAIGALAYYFDDDDGLL